MNVVVVEGKGLVLVMVEGKVFVELMAVGKNSVELVAGYMPSVELVEKMAAHIAVNGTCSEMASWSKSCLSHHFPSRPAFWICRVVFPKL